MKYDRNTALIVVDMQNDFVDPKGALHVPGAEALSGPINAEIDRAVAAGAPVVFTQDWHPPSTPHFEKDGGAWPVHCVRGSWGAALHPALRVPPGALLLRKGVEGEDGYSGFSVRDPKTGAVGSTHLARWLRERGVEALAIAGVATDYCVQETALDGVGKGFGTTVLTPLVRAVERTPGDGGRALEALARAGVRLEAP